MGGITNLTSQTFCDCLIDFFKRIIYPENSDEKLLAECSSSCTTPETRDRSINCCNSSYSTADCCGYDDISDDYLFLTRMIHESACDSYAHFFDFTFSAEIHIQLFPKTLSAWNLTLKRRRLERYCRKNPFVRYDMQFINNALKDMHYQQMKEKLLSDEHEFTECSSVSEGSGDSGKSKSNDGSNSSDVDISNNLLDDNCFCSVTRPSSPCRSNSTLSSGYSSEELSSRSSVTSNSSLSQYSCSCAPEARMNDDTSLNMEKTAKVAPELYSEINTVSLPSCLADNVDTCEDVLSKETLRPQQIDDSNNIVLPEENSSVSMARKEATYVDDVRLRTHIERAFKYCKLFEILEQSSNRFRISPTTCGLGLPLAHLDHCWPPVNAVRNIESNDIKYARRRTTSIYGKKQRRESIDEKHENAIPALGFDAVTLQYVSSSSSLSSSSNLYEQDSNFYVSEMDVLSEEIWDFHMSTTQSEEMLNLKIQLRDVLYCALSQLFPMCGLYIVGSSLNGFGTNSSDMDLCLMISSKEINQRTDAVVVLDLVRSLFNNMNFIREQKLIIAKVPILRIRFFEPYSKIVVDLNANNSVAIRNTQLLCYYSYYDWRVRPLVSVVKEWAKRRDINDANRSSFTSYSLVLMVIHYLQCEAQLLPSLQEKYPKVFNQRVDVRTLSVSVPLEPQGFCQKTFDSHDVPTLGELLLGFFEYFAKKFDYENDAISVRLGKKTKRSYVAKHVYPCNERMSQWNYICIEEPFNYSNTAHSVHDQYVFEQIRLALAEDYEKLEQTRDLHAFLDVNPLSSKPESFQRYNVAESVLNSYSESTTNNDSKNLCCQGDCVNNSDHDHKICGSNDSDGCSSDLSCEWQHSSNCELLPKADL